VRSLLFLTLFTALPAPAAPEGEPSLDTLGIVVRSPSREFAFTNKESAFLYGQTNSGNSTSWQGFNVFGHEFLDDYRISIDGKVLDRSRATTTVYPDYLRREYPGGIIEEVRPADSLALFFVTITAPRPVSAVCTPLLSDGHSAADFETALSPGALLIARRNHLARSASENYPVWLVLYSPGFTPVSASDSSGAGFSPGILAAARAKRHTVAFAVGDRREETESMARRGVGDFARLCGARRARMEALLAETEVTTSDRNFNRALAWAKLSLDALIMNQVARGIFAGLPWFNNYWGRDTFISLPGAALVTGHFAEARRILRSFADYQQRDSLSSDFGRIPNIVTTTDKAYNTADGTPRFVMMVREEVERSGDSLFAIEMYPVILRSIDGTLRYHTDSLGFLVHGDAETWMDAVGPDGPWSPRGNRANDIQALWAQQLEAGIALATQFGDVRSAREWDGRLKLLRGNFPRFFITPEGIVDHLTAEGKQDGRLRPNQIFTCPLLSDSLRARVVGTVTSRLTYEYGVASLSQDDPGFHPFHQHPPYYPKDAAYHNGTVWTWLQGPLISELCRLQEQDIAYKLTTNSVHQILERGAVGTQSELLDAIAHPGETAPRLSGTFSQAWNLAEFVRNFYDDYLGVRFDRRRKILTLAPHLPQGMTSARARINLDGAGFTLLAGRSTDELRLSYHGVNDTVSATAVLPADDGGSMEVRFMLLPGSEIRIMQRDRKVSASRNGTVLRFTMIKRPAGTRLRPSPVLARPFLRPGLASLKGPGYPLLPHETVTRSNPDARVILEASDPASDDTGTGRYTYPRNPNFVPGSFDIRSLTVSLDSACAYFRLVFARLSNPGWHPEYGFQLTFTGIAIDTGGPASGGMRRIGRNASFASEGGYQKIIFVGGGLSLEDARGTVLAAYVPVERDAVKPLGDSKTGTIRFALPLSLLGLPRPSWTFTVIAGAQDDHGGSGLGEFRSVKGEQEEWNGGGKERPDDPNVYDVLTAHPAP